MIELETVKSDEEVIIRAIIDYSMFSNAIEDIEEIERTIEQTINALGEEMKYLWINNAELQLKSSENYIEAINNGVKYPYNNSYKNYAIQPKFKKTVDGKDLGMILEYGYEPFDMKEKMLKGSDKKVVKFEYGLPGSGAKMELPKNIYNIALKHNMFSQYALTATKEPSIFGRRLSSSEWSEHLKPSSLANKINPNKLKAFTILKPNRISKDKDFVVNYAWKTRQFKGLRQSGQNKFSLFRTITKKSAPDSWINPGQVPKHIFKNSLEEFLPKIKPTFEKALAGFIN